jgi:hypothetical protein
MLNLGFLVPSVAHSEAGNILKVPAVVSRPGRPVQVLLTYEDMLNVEDWTDDSKLHFKRVTQGDGGLNFLLPSTDE